MLHKPFVRRFVSIPSRDGFEVHTERSFRSWKYRAASYFSSLSLHSPYFTVFFLCCKKQQRRCFKLQPQNISGISRRQQQQQQHSHKIGTVPFESLGFYNLRANAHQIERILWNYYYFDIRSPSALAFRTQFNFCNNEIMKKLYNS